MNKYDYFKLAYQKNMHFKRWWILRCYSNPVATSNDGNNGVSNNTKTIGYVYYDSNLQAYAVTENGTVRIDDHIPGTPLFGIKEAVQIKSNDFIIVKENTSSFYSNLLLNLVLLENPFKDKFPFHNAPFSTKFLDKLVGDNLKSGVMTVSEYRVFTKAVGFLMVLEQICVPTVTKKVLIPPANINKMKYELLEKHKDQLTDPVVVANIEKQLIEEYKKHLEGDRSMGFYGNNVDKYFNNTLKKSYIMFGGEPKIDDPSKLNLATPSLIEGWRIEDLPQMANSLRMGSYNRGTSTALGGEAAKFSSRIYQNTQIAEADCKSNVGVPVTISSYNSDMFTGRTYIEGSTQTEVTETVKLTEGKTYYFRSPQTCKTSNGNFCGVCMGRLVTESGVGLGPQASAVGNVFLSVALSLFHSASVTTEKYNYLEAID